MVHYSVCDQIDMADPREDDLFRESTMTFGQHLEELRKCLFKAIGGLLVGFLIGLVIGGHVVKFIQRPLSNALTPTIRQDSEDRINAELAKLKDAGQTSPWTTKQVKDFVEKGHLLADEYYVDPAQMLEELKSVYPKQFANVELPPTKPAERDAEAHRRQAERARALVPLAREQRRPSAANQEPWQRRSLSRSTSRRRCWSACC